MSDSASSVLSSILAGTGTDSTRLLDIALQMQRRLGYVGRDSMEAIADALDLRPVEVLDALSFYSFIRLEPPGKAIIHLSTCVAGRLAGSEAVERAFEKELGVSVGQRGADIALDHTSCIGMCDQSPAALVDGKVLTNLTLRDVPRIIKALRSTGLSAGRVESNIRQAGPVVLAPLERGAAIRAALTRSPEDVIEEIGRSRLRGRGGAGFPTAMKWSLCRKFPGEERFLVCNADEGEPGTFKDRVILTEAADLLFEGMTLAGYALGARQGFLYMRGEYEYLLPGLLEILERRRRLGLLGPSICGREGFAFDIRVQSGAGAYVCGEESSLVESLEGKRGAPRDRPPYPVQSGFLGKPTAVNNPETLCCAARIMVMGAQAFSSLGTRDSTGTKLLSVSGDCARPGVYELPFGVVIDELLEMTGAVDTQAVQVGGPSGQCLAAKDFGRRICFEDVPTGGSVMVFDDRRNLAAIVRDFTAFFAEESCGWCDPCRIGTSLLVRKLDKLREGKGVRRDLEELQSLGETVERMSRCGLGQSSAHPILSTMRNFPQLYERLIAPGDFSPELDLEEAMEPALRFTGRIAHGSRGPRKGGRR